MTITEGLVELKLLSSKINKAINSAMFIGVINNDKLGTSVETDFVKNAKSAYQSITDLIARRDLIKSAIVKANATTTLTVGGKTMTIAEAIEKKDSIAAQKKLLEEMRENYKVAKNTYEMQTQRAQSRLDNLLSNLVTSGKESGDMADTIKQVTDSFMAKNGSTLLDPIEIENKILSLEAQIDNFEATVDVALSIANARTEIEI